MSRFSFLQRLIKYPLVLKSFVFFVLSLGIVFGFQNCSRVKFSSGASLYDNPVVPLSCDSSSFSLVDVSVSTQGFQSTTTSFNNLLAGDKLYLWIPSTQYSVVAWSMKAGSNAEENLGNAAQISYPANASTLTAGSYVLKVTVQKSVCVGSAEVDNSPKTLVIPFVVNSAPTSCPDINSLSLTADDPKNINVPVNFNLSAPSGCAHSTAWTLGDGVNLSGGDAISHPYSRSGIYVASALVTYLPSGQQREIFRPVTIGASCPTIQDVFITGPSVTNIGTSNTFTVNVPTSALCNLNVSNVSFAFGDGDLSSDSTAPYTGVHSYSASGYKNVTATVSYGNGLIAVLQHQILVLNGSGSCTPNLTQSALISGPVSGVVNSAMNYSVDLPDCYVPAGYNANNITWEFKNSSNSVVGTGSGYNASRSFSAIGYYTVYATLTNTNFGTVVLSRVIYISDPNNCSNGANNPPTCNTCPSGKYFNGTSCVAQVCNPNPGSPTYTTTNGCPAITNGTSTKTCNAEGSAYGSCTSSCSAGYVSTGSQPNITCTIAPCTNGAINAPLCNQCSTGQYFNGTSCVPQVCQPDTTTATGCPTIPNGSSVKICNLEGSAYGSCQSTCSSGYNGTGTQPNITCSINPCTNGATNPPTCNTCPSGKYFNGTSCVAQVCNPNPGSPTYTTTNGCPAITNGTSTRTCNAEGSDYGSCVSSCAVGFNPSGTQPNISCTIAPCSNGAINPGTCNVCPAGQYFNGTSCSNQICVPSSVSTVGCPSIPNGASSKVCDLLGSKYSLCSSSCNGGYTAAGTQPNITCTILPCANQATNPPICNTCAYGKFYNPITNQCENWNCTPSSSTSSGCPAITNGTSTRNCDSVGSGYGSCTSSCFAGFNISGTQPNVTCTIAPCANGAINPGAGCNVCPAGQYFNGASCVAQVCNPNPGSPTYTTTNGCPAITNGTSSRTCNSQGSGYGSCTSSCFGGFNISGSQPNVSCTIPSCANGATNPSSGCTTCPAGFGFNGFGICAAQVCTPDPLGNIPTTNGCPSITNGTSTRTCNADGSAYRSCTSSCFSGYNIGGSQPNVTCTIPACTNGATNPGPCNICPSGQYFNGTRCATHLNCPTPTSGQVTGSICTVTRKCQTSGITLSSVQQNISAVKIVASHPHAWIGNINLGDVVFPSNYTVTRFDPIQMQCQEGYYSQVGQGFCNVTELVPDAQNSACTPVVNPPNCGQQTGLVYADFGGEGGGGLVSETRIRYNGDTWNDSNFTRQCSCGATSCVVQCINGCGGDGGYN